MAYRFTSSTEDEASWLCQDARFRTLLPYGVFQVFETLYFKKIRERQESEAKGISGRIIRFLEIECWAMMFWSEYAIRTTNIESPYEKRNRAPLRGASWSGRRQKGQISRGVRVKTMK